MNKIEEVSQTNQSKAFSIAKDKHGFVSSDQTSPRSDLSSPRDLPTKLGGMAKTQSHMPQIGKQMSKLALLEDPDAKPLYELERMPRSELKLGQLYYLSQNKFDKDDGYLLEQAVAEIIRGELNTIQIKCEQAANQAWAVNKEISTFQNQLTTTNLKINQINNIKK